MDVVITPNGTGSAVVSVTGELDVFTAPDLETRLSELIESGTSDVVIDLTSVEFLDSTGLGVMVKGLKWAKEAGGGLRVVAADEKIVKVFRITGLDEVMSLQPTLDS